VIGSDQAAVREGDPDTILGKPGTAERCIAQLQASSGRVVEFLTAVALVRQSDGATHQFVDTTRVRFRTLDRATIERYVKRESPLDCAGGFRSEGLGIALFEAIESTDPTALVGLPLIRLAALLRAAGMPVP
jgi:septum formation protein